MSLVVLSYASADVSCCEIAVDSRKCAATAQSGLILGCKVLTFNAGAFTNLKAPQMEQRDSAVAASPNIL